MTHEEFTNELNKSIVNLINPKVFIEIIRKDNNLARFDIMNKIAICTMNNGEQFYDLKTAEEWAVCNRSVIDKKKRIYITVPKYDTHYIDCVSLEKVNINEFSQDEFVKALELGIIRRERNITDVDVSTVYDIRNTSTIDKAHEYVVTKPKLSLDALINIMNQYMNLEVLPGEDETYYSKNSGKLFLAKNTYENMVKELVDILVKHIIDNKLSGYVRNYLSNTEKELNKFEIELLKEALKYSICTIFKVLDESNLLFEIRKNYVSDYSDILDILILCDAITFDISAFLDYSDNSLMTDAINNIELIRKSDILLSILQANSILNKMKGI